MSLRALVNAALLSIVISLCSQVLAADFSRNVTAHGLTVHYGFVPVRKLATPGADVLKRSDQPNADAYHLTVAIFDAKTGKRLSNATVLATVRGPKSQDAHLHTKPAIKHLEPTNTAGAVTYENDFDMPWNGMYHVELLVTENHGADPVKIRFDYEHKS